MRVPGGKDEMRSWNNVFGKVWLPAKCGVCEIKRNVPKKWVFLSPGIFSWRVISNQLSEEPVILGSCDLCASLGSFPLLVDVLLCDFVFCSSEHISSSLRAQTWMIRGGHGWFQSSLWYSFCHYRMFQLFILGLICRSDPILTAHITPDMTHKMVPEWCHCMVLSLSSLVLPKALLEN